MTAESYEKAEWPAQLRPCFYIETCFNCWEHQWCTRHQEERYINASVALRHAICDALGLDP